MISLLSTGFESWAGGFRSTVRWKSHPLVARAIVSDRRTNAADDDVEGEPRFMRW
jgi:hypothetical protein